MSGKPQILIVDDDPQICSYLERLLSRPGYETQTAQSGHEAVEFLARTPFHLVILDLGLPDLDGYEIFDEIGRKNPDTMTVFITGNASIESAVEMLKRGAYDYLKKPFEPEELLKAVGNALDYKQMERDRNRALESLQKAHDQLEKTVATRTSELAGANEQLKLEIEERTQAEEALRKSESQLNAILGSIADSMSMMDKDLNIIWANNPAKKIFGDHIIGKKCYEVYHRRKEPCEPYPCLTLRAFEDARIHEHETQVIDGDGNELHFHCRANVAITDEGGNPTAVLEISRDVSVNKRAEESLHKAHHQLEEEVEFRTAELLELNKQLTREMLDREETEKALRESEHRFRELVESSPVGICIIQQNQVIYQNPSMKRLLGPVSNGFENHVIDNIYPEDVEKCKAAYQQITAARNQTVEVDFRFLPPGKEGSGVGLHWVQCRASSVTLGGEKAMLLNVVDITKLKELERQVMIKSKMLSLGRVAAGIAHEIRNPLTGINSYLYTLDDMCAREALESDDMPMIRRIVEQIQLASNKIEAVIKRVIDFSRPGAPQMTLVDINACLEETISLSEVTLRKNAIKLEKSLAQDLPTCYADAHMIQQVVLNLTDNAAKALKRVKGPKIIRISSSSKKNSIFVHVSDSGPGVPAALRERVFDPFVTTETDGSGIGLSIAQRLIADHGGSIEIGSSEWGGAEFTIELPIEKRLNPR